MRRLLAAALLASACAPGRAVAPTAIVADTPIVGTLPRQRLDPGQCSLYLWSPGPPPRLVMAADATSARIVHRGRVVDLPLTRADGVAVLGLSSASAYGDAGVSLAVDVAIEPRPNLTAGALVPSGSLTVTEAGGDAVVLPVSGMVGCR